MNINYFFKLDQYSNSIRCPGQSPTNTFLRVSTMPVMNDSQREKVGGRSSLHKLACSQGILNKFEKSALLWRDAVASPSCRRLGIASPLTCIGCGREEDVG